MTLVSPSANGNFRSGNLQRGEALGAADSTVMLSANNQFVSPSAIPGGVPVSLIHVQSDNATASNRVFTLDNGQIMGQGLTLIFEAASNSCTLANSGNVKLQGSWTPVQYQSLSLEWNGTYWIEVGRSPSSVAHVQTTVTLTQANIIAMHTTPVTLLPAAAAGTAYMIDEIEVFHSYSTAAYTGGDDVVLQYDSGATAILLLDKTLVTNTSSFHGIARPTIYDVDAATGTSLGFDLAGATAKSVTVTNGTAVFAAGNVANTLEIRLTYHLVTVLT